MNPDRYFLRTLYKVKGDKIMGIGNPKLVYTAVVSGTG